ncbi:threonine ammonia-lyase [Halolamina litorea]|uniref:threonine ammonia-lyase n=1 Tax=Halolamina litorea TaxID=1515593 RepID=A0ABD6BRM3_9EURY|nr:threonine ammonia-lyase [Halolamina litorea]
MTVSLDDVRAARERLADVERIRETPVRHSATLGDQVGADVWLKLEHFQKTGSFKPRGAYNRICQIAERDEADRVVAASAGNHAQGVAFAATECGLESLVFMPETAPQAKIDATRGYGATVELRGETFAEAMAAAKTRADEPGTAFVHAYDDPDVIAGQGTLGLELLEQVPDLDTVIVPIGGGGLISGVATAMQAADHDVRVVGVQAEAAATAPQSLQKGEPVENETPDTIADGIATGSLSDRTFEIIQERVDEVVTVDDTEIANATLWLLERTKQMVEGAAAASVAPMLSEELDVEGTVVPLLCGGNIDIATLQDVLTRALVDRRQFVTLRIRIDDRPGVLGELATMIGSHDTNIRSVRHDRSEQGLPIGEADIVARLTTPSETAIERVIEDIEGAGYTVREVVPR